MHLGDMKGKVDVKTAVTILQDVLSHPERYHILQMECDMGSTNAEVGVNINTLNRLSISLAFVDNNDVPKQ